MLIHDLLMQRADVAPDSTALRYRETSLSYAELWTQVTAVAGGLFELGIGSGDRIAVWLPKQTETVIALFATAAAGGSFVPVNPVLKPRQVAYQLGHCDARVLVTSRQRLESLRPEIPGCPALTHVVVVDDPAPEVTLPVHRFSALLESTAKPMNRRIDADMAAILYTSGSTGLPKGVVVSHRNLVAGARSVSQYLNNSPADRILSVLPLSFDAGLSQVTTAFFSGASVTLMDYLLPRDVIRTIEREEITGLTGVPPLWNALARLEWPAACVDSLRYIANTGGAMAEATTRSLAQTLPKTDIFLMYGLTEAFRSTFLPPGKALQKPDSVGRAIPDAEVLIVNEKGLECAPGEHGELVHRGVHVAMGYWKNPEATAKRFRPAPGRPEELPLTELAVWSGDTAYRDEDGDIFFVSRNDAMIKSSGYRISPTEIEAEALSLSGVDDAVAVGAPHPDLGQVIVLFIASENEAESIHKEVQNTLASALPTFMVPKRIVVDRVLPLNPNGKVDRAMLAADCADMFTAAGGDSR